MPRSRHYYTLPEPMRKTAADLGLGGEAAKADDDSLLSLSLGDIYRNNAPAPAMAKAADAGGFLRSPVMVTPTAPPPVRRAPSPFVAAVHTPPRLDLADLVAEGRRSSAFTPVVINKTPTTTPSHHKAFSDGAIDGFIPALLPARGDDAAFTTPPAPRKRSRSGRCRRSSAATTTPTKIAAAAGEDATVEIEGGLHVSPPYAWSTSRVGVHHSLAELSRRGIGTITGELQCKRCDGVRHVQLDVEAKFRDLHGYISRNVHGMDDRAPARWKEPALPDCERCGQRGSMRPVIPADKHRINWVFLLLTETLGLCTLEQLKHFCAHTHQHRTGAKDRVLYSTYMELCNQLLPDDGLFDMASQRQKRARQIAY